jgi:hypothetical protein
MSKKKTTGHDKLQISTFRDRPDFLPDRQKKTRVKRPRDEWPDPDQPRFAEVNRQDALFQARIDEDTADRVKAFIEASGMQKKDFTEQALNCLLDELEPQFGIKRPKQK